MAFLTGRIKLAEQALMNLEDGWKLGISCSTNIGARITARRVAREFGYAFIYAVRVHSLNLPISIVEYHVTPHAITRRLYKTRLLEEVIIFDE